MCFLLALLFARYLPFYLCLSRSLSLSFYRNSTVLASSLTFLRVFLDSLYVLYFLFIFARYLPFYLCLSRSLSLSFYRNSTVLASSLTFLRVFLDSLYVLYFLFIFWALSLFLFILFSLKTLSPQT